MTPPVWRNATAEPPPTDGRWIYVRATDDFGAFTVAKPIQWDGTRWRKASGVVALPFASIVSWRLVEEGET